MTVSHGLRDAASLAAGLEKTRGKLVSGLEGEALAQDRIVDLIHPAVAGCKIGCNYSQADSIGNVLQ